MKLIQQLSDYLLLEGLITVSDMDWLKFFGYLPKSEESDHSDYEPLAQPEPIPESDLDVIEEQLVQEALRLKSELPSRASKGAQRKRKRIVERRKQSEQERDARRKAEADNQISSAQQLPPASALLALHDCLLSAEPWLKSAARQVLTTIASTSAAKFLAVLESLMVEDKVSRKDLIEVLGPAWAQLRTKPSFSSRELVPLLYSNLSAINRILLSLHQEILPKEDFTELTKALLISIVPSYHNDRSLLCTLLSNPTNEVHQEAFVALKRFTAIPHELASDLQQGLHRFDPAVQGKVLGDLFQREIISVLSLDDARILTTHGPNYLYLTSVSDISADVLRLLIPGAVLLNLSGLKELKLEVAQELKSFKGYLHLDGLEQITPEIASVLAERNGFLSMFGLKSLSTDVAACLGRHQSDLILNGVKRISTDVAKELSQHKGTLKLNGLVDVSLEVAKELTKLRCPLYLNGLEHLTEAVAEVLSHHTHPLWLCGLQELTLEAAQKLQSFSGELRLNGVERLSTGAAESLGKRVGNLYLDSLQADADVIKGLCHCRGDLWLGRMSTLTDRMALVLSWHSGTLGLQGLKNLTLRQARTLARHDGTIKLGSIQGMSSEVRDLIAEDTLFHYFHY